MNKANGGDGIPVELFQILKDDVVKVLHLIYQQIWKICSGHTTVKISFHSNPKEGQCQGMLKLLYTCAHFICQQGYAQIPSSQASVVREPRTFRGTNQIQKRQRNQRSNWIIEKAREFQKNIYFCFIDYAKAFVWITTNSEKLFKTWEYQTT